MTQPQKTALIVDDEEPIRSLLSAQLEALGYECVAVCSGQEALKTVVHQEFDLMMLDVKMPAMSGLEVLKKFRAHHPGTCVVMLTGLVETDIAAKAMQLGADEYMTKPWYLDDLHVRLQRAYERRKVALQGQSERLPFDEAAQKQVDYREITKDLINQQMDLHKRLTSPSNAVGQEPKRRRWWT